MKKGYDPTNDILGAIRKKGAFVWNQYSWSQQKYKKPLAKLVADGVIVLRRECAKDHWEYEKGPMWTRRV